MKKTATMEAVKLLLILGINAAVQSVWVIMELIAYGEPRPSNIDTIIGLALTFSLYINLRHYVSIGGDRP